MKISETKKKISYDWIQKNLPVILAILTVVVLAISLIPILYVSFYSHPLYDDFGFSEYVHDAIINDGGFFKIIAAAFSQVKESYFSWQGTFSAIFLFSLQPGVFSDDLYFLTTFIMVFILIVSYFFFIDTFVVRWMKSRRSYGVLTAGLILFCSIQFVYDKREGFYWYNGASYYTIFYSLSLILFALLIRMALTEGRKKRIALFVASILLAAFVGGGNYTTCLLTAIVLFLAVLVQFKNKFESRRLIAIIFIVFMISFVISMVAPGNSVRAALCDGMSPIKAIFLSVFYAFVKIGEWTDLQQVAVFLFLTPFIFNIAKKSNFSFKYPFIVIVIAFGCFAAQMTPSLYALSSLGSGRQINIYYYAYYFLMLFIIFYLCGWLSRKNAVQISLEKISTPINSICGILVILVLFGAGCFEYSYHNMTSVDTTLAIINGTVYEYDAEYEEILEEIQAGTTYVNDIETSPDFFGQLGITAEDDYWVNRQIAEYFNVDYFYLDETE